MSKAREKRREEARSRKQEGGWKRRKPPENSISKDFQSIAIGKKKYIVHPKLPQVSDERENRKLFLVVVVVVALTSRVLQWI